jgi:hypothetical protein
MNDADNKRLIPIILAAIVLLALGEAYFYFAVNHSAGQRSVQAQAQADSGPQTPAVDSAAALAPSAGSFAGTITSIGNGSFVITHGASSTPSTVTVSSGTMIVTQGDPSGQVMTLSFSSLKPGDAVVVAGASQSSGTFAATRVTDVSASSR